MEKGKIYYKKGYKYQLCADYQIMVPIYGVNATTLYVELTKEGALTICTGYAWDGASGPTIDTKSSMRATLVHDALDQLLREGRIPLRHQAVVDQMLYDIGKADGMLHCRIALWLKAVSLFGKCSLDPDNGHPLIIAP